MYRVIILRDKENLLFWSFHLLIKKNVEKNPKISFFMYTFTSQ